jgi:hypothetical protein
MLVNALASSAIDMGMQYITAASQGKDPWKEMRWGSVGASFVSGALTTGAMSGIAKAGGTLAANTFNAMLSRSIISNGIDLGVRSIGLAIDSKAHHLDYGKELGKQALSNLFNVGTDVTSSLGNHYLMRSNDWDPKFTDFKDRVNEYNNPNMRRWDPGSLNKGLNISNPSDYLWTTTQRSVITFTVIEEYYYFNKDNGNSKKNNDNGTIYIPTPHD